MQNQNCHFCKSSNGTLNNSILLCNDCNKKSNNNLISTAISKKNYILVDDDFENLQYAQFGKSKYYILKDINKVVMAKYYTLDVLKIRELNKKIKIKLNNKYKKDKQKLRLAEITKCLKTFELDIRKFDNIPEVEEYLEKDKSGFTLDHLVELCREMEFYWEHTRFEEILHELELEFTLKYKNKNCNGPALVELTKVNALKEYVKMNKHDKYKIGVLPPSSLKDKIEVLYKKK